MWARAGLRAYARSRCHMNSASANISAPVPKWDFAGIAEAAERAAAAPFAAKRMPGKRDRGKRSRPQFVRW